MSVVRNAVAGASCALIAIALVAASFDDNTSKPMLINGDAAGMERGEAFSSYRARAEQSLNREGQAFALVTFEHPLTAQEAGEAMESWDIPRVSALTLPLSKPVELPEPVAPETRIDVARRAQRTVPEAGDQIAGAVVYGNMAEVRTIAAQPQVAAVEALPEGAAWGRFGLRPVDPSRG